MSLNSTPSADRIHIGIFGKRNAGKSSIINAITSQNLAIVSDIAGTTTDPVSKAMELLPLGPVVITDTPGLDDDTALGAQRVEKTRQVIGKTDIAIVVIDASLGRDSYDDGIIDLIKEKNIPYITVYNKCDLTKEPIVTNENEIAVSAKTGANINELKERIALLKPKNAERVPIISDIITRGDLVVLVIPIDESAPKGRLILPQQQTIRELLECGAYTVCVKETELADYLKTAAQKPKLVITDSQAFKYVSECVPEDILLTSFSILFSRHKGNLENSVKGVSKLKSLKDNSTVLISEGCTHHRQCNDIGSVKLPKMITSFTGKRLNFEFSSGTEFPRDIKKYDLVIHCGGCMLNETEMKSRVAFCVKNGVPVTNYGITIAFVNGILERSLEVFPKIRDLI
ncbi:MAG: [FeFe] hydrogenase H-cluster maturation GTPase HydF [Clostridiales bacterium]|nr:[FeFe] hydrogenase H-cluster maturation GTPase HydF [Clostridiales bacterium]